MIRAILAAGALVYFAFAIVTPPFQTPDEHQHLYRAWQLAHFQLHGERRGEQAGGMVPIGLLQASAPEIGSQDALVFPRPIPKRPLMAMFARATPVSDTQPRVFADFLGAVIYSPVGYVPQIVAVWTATALGWPVEGMVRLGRILNAILALSLFSVALRIIPSGRLSLLLLALMPMTAASAASLGQDGLVLSSCAMVIALSVRARREHRWSTPSLWLLLLSGSILALTKFVYTPLLVLALFPLPRECNQLRWIGWPVALALLNGLLSVLWFHSNAGSLVPHAPGLPNPGGQIDFVARHPAEFVAALARTALFGWGPILLSTFSFGWLTVGPVLSAAILAGAALVVAWWNGEAEALLPDRPWRSWAAIIGLVIGGGIATAMYIGATPVGWNWVVGLQGRYFLPLLPLALLAAVRGRRLNRSSSARLSVLLIVGSNISALSAIFAAFYTI
jgi:uncharacterized membrane protein